MNVIAGIELEFYIHCEEDVAASSAMLELKHLLSSNFGVTLENEYSAGQYEIIVPHSKIMHAVNILVDAKAFTISFLAQKAILSIFDAQPFEERYGSAMHWHIHIQSNMGNVFGVGNYANNEHIKRCIYGILNGYNKMLLQSPNIPIMRRNPSIMTPAGLCWGWNNRSAAIRIPEALQAHRRLELRVPNSDDDPMTIATFIITAIEEGYEYSTLNQYSAMYPRIYGNAHSLIYDIIRFGII